VKDVVLTVVLGIVLAIAFMYTLASCAASGWGDRPIEESMRSPMIQSTPLPRNV